MTSTTDRFEDWLMAELDQLTAEVDVFAATSPPMQPKRRWVASAVAVALIAAGLSGVWQYRQSSPDLARTEAVASTIVPVNPALRPMPTDLDPALLVAVRGIEVHRDVAAPLEALLAAAEVDGIVLSGTGYHSVESQINLRIDHCGSTNYDIWEKSPALCSPPTAIPGQSTHHDGVAVDFTADGSRRPEATQVVTLGSVEFEWLQRHAEGFGFRNVPSEPWHWEFVQGVSD